MKGTNVAYTISQVRVAAETCRVRRQRVRHFELVLNTREGETVLKQYAGMDITDAFRAYHSKDGKAMKTLKTLALVLLIERLRRKRGDIYTNLRLMEIRRKQSSRRIISTITPSPSD